MSAYYCMSINYYTGFFLEQKDKHQPLLVKLICDKLNIQPEQMMDFELCLADTQPAVSISEEARY